MAILLQKDPNPDIMVSIALVDLSEHEDLFYAVNNSQNRSLYNDLYDYNIICDDKTKTVWLQWYNGEKNKEVS